jgi:flagellar FliJ protein
VKKFRFRLERVLSLKTTLKKQAQKALAEAENEKRKQQGILISLNDELSGRMAQEKSRRTKKLDLGRLELAQKYFGQLALLIAHQTKVLKEAEAKVVHKRKNLLEASKEVQKFEKLKEIRKDEYTHELELMLQKETDEFAKNVHRLNSQSPQ